MRGYFGGTSPRFYCPLSPAFGHTSSTIGILKRFIALGLITDAEIVYEDDDVLDRLRTLLPQIAQGANPPPIKISSQGNTADVTLTAQPQQPLGGHEKLAITGGWDHPDQVAAITTLLNVDWMLVLQPYTWELENNQAVDVAYFPNAQQAPKTVRLVEQLPDIEQMLYFRPPPGISGPEWIALGNLPGRAATIAAAKAVVDGVTTNNRLFCPVYGISNVAGKVASSQPPPVSTIVNLCAAARALQSGDQQAFQKGVVILVLTPLKPETWTEINNVVTNQNQQNKPATLQAFIQNRFYPGNVSKVLVRNQLTQAGDITNAIANLGNDQVLVLNIPQGVPQDVFELFYGMATIPCIFEGAGTAPTVLNLANPFFRLANVAYPVLPLLAQPSRESTLARDMVAVLRRSLGQWSQTADQTPPPVLAAYITECLTNGTDMQKYFAQFAADQAISKQNDKLFCALWWCLVCKQFRELQGQLRAAPSEAAVARFVAPRADDPVLDQVYQNLMANYQGGVLNLVPGAYPTGSIASLYKPISTGGNLLITGTIAPPDEQGQIVVTGTTDSLLGFTGLAVRLVFTDGEQGVTSALHVSKDGLSWSLANAPWFAMKSPSFDIVQADADAPATGAVGGTIMLGGTAMDLSLGLPIQQNRWVFDASFSGTQPSLASVSALVGGIDLPALLPPPLDAFSDLAIQRFEIMYDATSNEIGYFSVQVGTTKPWPLFGNVTLGGLTITTTVISPADLGKRTTRFDIGASFPVGPGNMAVTVTAPGLVFSGNLVQPADPNETVMLGDVASLFLPAGVTVPINAAVDVLDFGYNQPEQSWNVACDVLTDWKLPSATSPLFDVENLGFAVQGRNGAVSGSFYGTTTILPESVNPVTLTVTASYEDKLWTFEGRQSDQTPLKIGDLVKRYLGFETLQTWDIDDLYVKLSQSGAYTVSGKTVLAFGTDVIPTLTLKGDMELSSTGQPNGYSGQISIDIELYSIALTLGFSFSQATAQETYFIRWGGLLAQLAKKSVGSPPAPHWIATVTLSGMTVGGLVEQLISWATGQKFGLGAPWNVLDKISLDGLSLVFDLTAKTVQLTLPVGLNLGFASIDDLSLTYDASAPSRKVNVVINGKFFWQDDPSQPLQWDATDPGKTPAPPGNGNAYVDLRLLAMGQHVGISGFQDFTTVQAIVAAMEKLPTPQGGQIPVGKTAPPGQPFYDPSSAWMVGTDMGILQSPDKKSYFLTLQIVFYDPKLYALRVALSGPTAKIFAGLDFQIMYRQISDSVGVYQSEIKLPDAMRNLTIGAYSITLPVIGFQIYTNGDFLIDLGFPWNQDFSRSFTVQGIVPPGIPLIGSGGLYFGKLSGSTATQVPHQPGVELLGNFNPVIVFGVGMQVGVGKTVEYGPLSAGISITVLAIIEGVIARWNPNKALASGDPSQLQTSYYWKLQGTAGIAGRLFGSVDFVVVKASVDVSLSLVAQITIESYADIPISVIASVRVTASLEINLGIFSITIHFRFSASIKETFTLPNPERPSDAPWYVPGSREARRLDRARVRLRSAAPLLRAAAVLAPSWSLLVANPSPAHLQGYVVPALTVGGDGVTLASQVPCYVLTMALQAPDPSVPWTPGAADTALEALCKMVFRWMVAAMQPGPAPQAMTAAQVDATAVTADHLDDILSWLSQGDTTSAIPPGAISTFMAQQFVIEAGQPASVKQPAAFFPMAPDLSITREAYGALPRISYTFGGFNAVPAKYITDVLQPYFAKLEAQVEDESSKQARRAARRASLEVTDGDPSMAALVFSDYFVLIARQMVQAAKDALRDHVYAIQPGDTARSVVAWVGKSGGATAAGAFGVADLFEANAGHTLSAGQSVTVQGVVHTVVAGDTLASIAAALSALASPITAAALAEANATASGLLAVGQKVGAYSIKSGDTLAAVASALGFPSVTALVQGTSIATQAGLLVPVAKMAVPALLCPVQPGADTLAAVGARFGVAAVDLANADGSNDGLAFDPSASSTLDLTHLTQLDVGPILAEIQRTNGLTHLAGMASRYFLHGLRLPTSGIQPGEGIPPFPPEMGLFALTGQQIQIPSSITPQSTFTLTLDNPSKLSWINLGAAPARKESLS